MGLFKKFVSQTRKPEGFLGKMMIRSMNPGHAKMADWGMGHLKMIAPERILDIGCGGGRNAAELLKKYPDSRIAAIDYSPLSVEQAAAYNRDAVATGRCVVQQGDVSSLPFDDSTFHLATAFETIYFWPGLEKCFKEVFRVLRPRGRFLIVNESDGLDAAGRKFEKIIDGMKIYTEKEIKAALESAGFTAVKTDHYKNKPWITVLPEKQI